MNGWRRGGLFIIGLALLLAVIAGCTKLDMQPWVDAKVSNEQARAAAEWARAAQVQAEAAAESQAAPARAQARTAATTALWAVLVLTVAGLGAALVTWAWVRARQIFTDEAGLYPAIVGNTPTVTLNEPGAQHARIAPGRTPVQVLPPAQPVDAIPVIPQPIEIVDAQRLAHIERLLLDAPAGSVNHDDTD